MHLKSQLTNQISNPEERDRHAVRGGRANESPALGKNPIPVSAWRSRRTPKHATPLGRLGQTREDTTGPNAIPKGV